MAQKLLKEPLESVPRFLIMRDLLQMPPDDTDLTAVRQQAMQSALIADLSGRQLPDGSFGRFALQTGLDNPNGGANEAALIRALSLGLDEHHPMMASLRQYLESELEKSVQRCQHPHDGEEMLLARMLVLSGCLRQLNSRHPDVLQTISHWQTILTASFNGNEFQSSIFRDRCDEIFGFDNGFWPEHWPEFGFSRSMLLLMKDQLPYAVEQGMISYLINNTRGIYPISNRSLKYFPLEFASRECIRFISSLELLAQYLGAAGFLRSAADWIWEQLGSGGYWDLGKQAGDQLYLPLSGSWRSKYVRQRDCTVRILILLSKLQQTCELYDTTCHFI